MTRDARYDVLFEPVKIGPVTARNRFYQVPHCNGMGYRYPQSLAAMRGVKAEGGWAVVSTEEVEIHPTSDVGPYLEGRLWDEQDLPALRRMTDAVHAHGALAAIEFAYQGSHAANRYSRLPPMAPTAAIHASGDPQHAYQMDKEDIRNVRRWHLNAARLARKAGFDIIYVYAGHDLVILQHFLSRRHNQRSDEYGGSLQNRVRLFREVLEETKDAVGDTCGIAVRMAVDELLGSDGIEAEGEGHDVIAMLAELPDLWDVNVSAWHNDSQTARFAEEGYQEPYIRFVKKLTTKPVVGVGRYTSPDAMVRVIRQGIMDMIGSARPSIADPFLPKKIAEGRIEDIRECIGCNICVSGDYTMTPIRCTQNPSMGEEWRRGWHPEIIAPATTKEAVLVVGGGPAGLEAARALGARGLEVTIAEKGSEWGGRSAREARLPGLSSYARVKDWRLGQLAKLANVAMYLASDLTADDVLGQGQPHVALATGASWRRDGVGRSSLFPIDGIDSAAVLTPDDVMAGRRPAADGPVLVYDDEGYYLAGVIAELLAREGHEVQFATPATMVSPWTVHTMEQGRIQARMIELGVGLQLSRTLKRLSAQTAQLACVYSGAIREIACRTLVPVTSRLADDHLWHALKAREAEWADAGIRSVTRIGDGLAPGTVAAAVFAGHRYARLHGEVVDIDVPDFRREAIDAGVA
ncbi:MAG: NAD(P)-binding protein [Hyphomicrobiaceae bacterium]